MSLPSDSDASLTVQGRALRLVAGVIPYRDFSMVQPPGGMLLMVPAALLGKGAGTAWGLAAARLLTVGADTANVILVGVLVRRRGPLAAGIACGVYAVYPDAIIAAHTFLLEPWLNLFCLAGAAAIFDGDRLAGSGLPLAGSVAGPAGAVPRPRTAALRAPRWSDGTRLLCGGLLLGFAAAVKIWALVPLAIAVLVLLAAARRLRPAAALAAGAAVGAGVPLLPFALLAPAALARGVLIGQLVRNANGPRQRLQRVADLAGLGLHPFWAHEMSLLALIAAALVGCCAAAYLRVGPTALDAYAVAGAVAVTAMLLWPRLYYAHYGAFDGPFLSLAIALPAGLLATRGRPARPAGNPAPPGSQARRPALAATVAAATALLIVGAGYRQLRAEAPLRGVQVAAAADRLIPAGACVVSNGAAYTVAADRFSSDVPGCPALVDPLGTMIAMTTGRFRGAAAAELRPEVDLWQSALERAQYVWLTSDTYEMIPWNRPLDGYFTRHFRLIGLGGHLTGYRYVPRVGLYART